MAQDIYITGSGHTRFGRLADNLETLVVDAAREAMADAGVGGAEVDGVFLGHFNSGLVPDAFSSSLVLQADPELRYKPATRCENACASGAAAIFAGMNAILAGKAGTVLVVGAEKMTSNSTAEVTCALAGAGYQNDPDEAGLNFPQVFGIAARQYHARHTDPLPAMARIASKNHANAMANPLAQMHRPMSVEECATVTDRNPEIAPPLRLTDCSLITDGAAAIVLQSASAAADARRRVRFAGTAHVSDIMPLSRRDFLAFEGPRRAIEAAYKEAGVSVADLDFAEVHDCFTIAELLIYEAMGLAPAGQGTRALDEGTVFADGRTPVNLSGGLKAKGHPVGATGVSMHALAFRQLTRQAGEMQRKGAELGLVFNMGGAAVANFVSVLAADRA